MSVDDDELERLAKARELEQLAKTGREIVRAEHEAKQTATDEAALRPYQVRNSVSTFSRWGWIASALGIAATLSIACTVAFAIETRPILGDIQERRFDGSDVLMGAFFASATLLTVLFYLLREPMARRAVAREEQWLAHLPFAASGYWEAIGSSKTEGRAVLTIDFAPARDQVEAGASFRTAARTTESTPPDDETVEAVFRTIGGEFSSQGGVMRVGYSASFEGSVFTNAHLVEWLHRAMRVLELLHERHPIERVHIKGF